MGDYERVLGGKYTLDRLIASGGMGEVYQATNLQIGRSVAVKLLQSDRATDEVARRRFLREARAAACIEHENVCEVFDSGVDDDGTLYTVMTLLRGEPLSQAIEAGAPFPIERAVSITLQILSALRAARAVGVVHRDLKPDNVFLTRVGVQDDFVKVLDFGISKVIGESAESEAALTQTDRSLGTPAYMAPEQARNAKNADWRVDIYAAGGILYEMLTGRRPVEGESSSEILWNLWNEPITPPRAHRAEISPALEAVVLRALARDPSKRYQRAEDFAAELGAAADVDVPLELERPPSAHEQPLATGPTETGDESGPFPPSAITKSFDDAKPPSRERAPWLSRVLGVVLVVAVASLIAEELWFAPGPGGRAHEHGESVTERSNQVAVEQPVGEVAPAEVTEAGPRAEEPRPLAEEPQDNSAGQSEASVADQRRVRLMGLPPRSRVTLDGRPVEGDTVLVPTGSTVSLAVRAPRHRPWRRRLRVDADRTLRVGLIPLAPRTTPGASGRDSAGPHAQPPGRVLDGTITDFERIP